MNNTISNTRVKKVYDRVLKNGKYLKTLNNYRFYNESGTVFKLNDNTICEAESETVYVCLDCGIELTQDNAHLKNINDKPCVMCDNCNNESVYFIYYN